MHLYEHQIATNASQQMTKVTEMVREDIERSGVREGIAVIFSPHTTAGLRSMRMRSRMWCMICCVALEKVFPAEQFFYPACRRKFACTYEDDGGRTVTDAVIP